MAITEAPPRTRKLQNELVDHGMSKESVPDVFAIQRDFSVAALFRQG
jgi:hypothetical protein